MTHNALKNGENSAIRKYLYSFEEKKKFKGLWSYIVKILKKIALFLHSRTQTNQILERKATLFVNYSWNKADILQY